MKKNIIFAAAVLLLAGICLVLFRMNSAAGKTALVTIVDAKSITIPLNKNATYHIDDGKLPVTLVVENGTICFTDSQCPDHVCEGFGKLANENEQAICLPAGVVVTVEN